MSYRPAPENHDPEARRAIDASCDRFERRMDELLRRQRVQLAIGVPIAYLVGRLAGETIAQIIWG